MAKQKKKRTVEELLRWLRANTDRQVPRENGMTTRAGLIAMNVDMADKMMDAEDARQDNDDDGGEVGE